VVINRPEFKRASRQAKIRGIPRNMRGEYFYVRFRFSPKIGARTGTITRQHEVVVEVTKDLVQREQSEFMNENPREKAIALDFARRAALAIFSTGERRLALLHRFKTQFHRTRKSVKIFKGRICGRPLFGALARKASISASANAISSSFCSASCAFLYARNVVLGAVVNCVKLLNGYFGVRVEPVVLNVDVPNGSDRGKHGLLS
jgi:hypothetical protein